MRTPYSNNRISRSFQGPLNLVFLLLSLGNMCEARAEEEARLRVAAVSASRRTCAAEALRFCLLLQGRSLPTLTEIERKLPIGYDGVSAADMADLCESAGIPIRAVKTTLDDLSILSSPSILHVDDRHFIVVVKIEGKRLLLFDNAVGLIDCTRGWFRENYQWSGTALVLGERTSSLWFFFRSPWSLSLSAGVLVMILGIRLLTLRSTKHEASIDAPS
jgi:ABC-type bacteriocin/lantibiotic exporter with double-glycine peptidase domain